MKLHTDVLIAGAGQGAAQLASSLRQGGFEGSITMVGDEPHPPYERPPLSKDYLLGKREAHRLYLRKSEAWTERKIEILTNRRITEVNRAEKIVRIDTGERLTYQWLVWATGGKPRQLDCNGHTLAGIQYIRSISDIDAIKADLNDETHVAIIGGGYIGLETAAVLRSLGRAVTLIEAHPRLLSRVTSEVVSAYVYNMHTEKGVDIRLGCGVVEIMGTDHVEGVKLTSGEIIPATMVIAGIGIIPNVEPLQASGLNCPNGVQTDEFCQTSDPHVLAIGDCAFHPNPHAAGHLRLESVQNAIDQAKTAASVILGQPDAYAALPWFWSDQYGLKLQTAGLFSNHDQIVVRGDLTTMPFSVAYLKEGRLVAMDCLGTTRDFVQCKRLILDRVPIDDITRLADPSIELKSLA